MTPQQIKNKVIRAWLLQTEKYAWGPVIGETYCCYKKCFLCQAIMFNFGICELCPLYIDGVDSCTKYMTYDKLDNVLRASQKNISCPIENITDELIEAMSLRHRFYIRGYNEILKDAPPERFASGEGFPELLEIDRELAETIGENI